MLKLISGISLVCWHGFEMDGKFICVCPFEGKHKTRNFHIWTSLEMTGKLVKLLLEICQKFQIVMVKNMKLVETGIVDQTSSETAPAIDRVESEVLSFVTVKSVCESGVDCLSSTNMKEEVLTERTCTNSISSRVNTITTIHLTGPASQFNQCYEQSDTLDTICEMILKPETLYVKFEFNSPMNALIKTIRNTIPRVRYSYS